MANRAPSRRAILAMVGGAAVTAPVVSVNAVPMQTPTAPDPAIAAWRELQQAMRLERGLGARASALRSRRDELTAPLRPSEWASDSARRAFDEAEAGISVDCGYDAAWERWCEADETARSLLRRLIAVRPTTSRGVLAKIAAAKRLIEHDEEHGARKMLASLLATDPDTLGRR